MHRIILVASLFILFTFQSFSQITGGSIRGSFETNFQYYQEDEKLGISDSSLAGRPTAINSYANLLYSSKNLEAGIRYEYYAPPLTGYDTRYEGMGISNRYLRFQDDSWDITVGNYYEQFGNGMLFRTYHDWALGYDNSMDGLRVKYRPANGLYLRLISGVQRLYWDNWDREDDRGILNGFDAEINLNEAFKKLTAKKTNMVLGVSFLTRYQKDKDPFYKTPNNTAGFAGRFNLNRSNISLIGEYTYKINDPSSDNGMIYKPGEAIYIQGGYSVKGFSFSLAAKRLDNMSFRSDRNAKENDLMINYLPAINKQHIYSLPAYYPYATQPTGEMGFMTSLGYKIKKGKLGGRYGTDITIHFSRITDIARDSLDSTTPIGQKGTKGYKSNYLSEGEKYFEDLSVEIQRRLTKNLKLTLIYAWINYNIKVIQGHGEENVISHNMIADLTWKFSSRQALRIEAQHLGTKQDEGSWAFAAVEYTNRGFFASVQNQWNYGNPEKAKQIHYIMASTGYTRNATRIAASYGRQNDGIICTGGICRYVPAISGFSLTITSSF